MARFQGPGSEGRLLDLGPGHTASTLLDKKGQRQNGDDNDNTIMPVIEVLTATYVFAVAAGVLAKFVNGLNKHADIAAHLGPRSGRVLLACHPAVRGIKAPVAGGEILEVFLLCVGEFGEVFPLATDFAAESRQQGSLCWS